MSLKQSNTFAELLDTIQQITGHSLDEIAKRMGISRPYLSKRKVQTEEDDAVRKMISLAKARYAKELKSRILDEDQIRTLNAWVIVLENEVAAFRSERTGLPIQAERQKLQKAVDDVIKRL